MSNSIVLTRIDDRLIHGQVMTSWLNYTSATKIMVIEQMIRTGMIVQHRIHF